MKSIYTVLFIIATHIIVFLSALYSGFSQEYSYNDSTALPSPFVRTSMHDTRLTFRPYIAAQYEGRIGSLYQQTNNRLRLDIGNSVDLSNITPMITIGADFFTLTQLRSEGNFKFPVETTDFYFGMNVSTRPLHVSWFPKPIAARIRIAHISSHLVDGLADTAGTLNPKPFVYSREFIDLSAAVCFRWFRPYLGLTVIWATQPRNPNRILPQMGFDFDHPIGKKTSVMGGVDMRLVGIDGNYQYSFSAQSGILFSNENRTGFSINLYLFSGRSIHGMLYRENSHYLGTGFQFHY